MSREIEEMAEVYENARLKARDTLGSMNEGEGMWYSKAFYKEGYRKQVEGEWKEIPIYNYDGEPSGLYYVCSVCHTDNGYEDTPFCPNCGAIMKGAKE
jgi:rubrerythrin